MLSSHHLPPLTAQDVDPTEKRGSVRGRSVKCASVCSIDSGISSRSPGQLDEAEAPNRWVSNAGTATPKFGNEKSF